MVWRVSMVVLLAAGCSGEDVELDGSNTSEPTSSCAGAEPFTVGMAATSTLGNTVVIAQASPAPPDVGDNRWTLEITDASGNPLPGLTVDVHPFMPLHNHGLTPARYAAEDLGDGTYDVETFDLIMPGTWEFTVDLAVGGEAEDAAVFSLCAEG